MSFLFNLPLTFITRKLILSESKPDKFFSSLKLIIFFPSQFSRCSSLQVQSLWEVIHSTLLAWVPLPQSSRRGSSIRLQATKVKGKSTLYNKEDHSREKWHVVSSSCFTSVGALCLEPNFPYNIGIFKRLFRDKNVGQLLNHFNSPYSYHATLSSKLKTSGHEFFSLKSSVWHHTWTCFDISKNAPCEGG